MPQFDFEAMDMELEEDKKAPVKKPDVPQFDFDAMEEASPMGEPASVSEIPERIPLQGQPEGFQVGMPVSQQMDVGRERQISEQIERDLEKTSKPDYKPTQSIVFDEPVPAAEVTKEGLGDDVGDGLIGTTAKRAVGNIMEGTGALREMAGKAQQKKAFLYGEDKGDAFQQGLRVERSGKAQKEVASEMHPLAIELDEMAQAAEKVDLSKGTGVIAAAKRGRVNHILDRMIGTAAATGDFERANQIKAYRKSLDEMMNKNDPESKSKVLGLLRGVSEMSYGLVVPALKGAVTAGAGAVQDWWMQGAGDIYSTATDAGASDENAAVAAVLGGALYSGLGMMQLGQLTNIGKDATKEAFRESGKKFFAKLLKEKGADWAKEVAEEGAQKFISDFASYAAADASGASKEEKQEIFSHLKDNLSENDFINMVRSVGSEIKGAAGPMGVLSAFGIAGGTAARVAGGDQNVEAQEVVEQFDGPVQLDLNAIAEEVEGEGLAGQEGDITVEPVIEDQIVEEAVEEPVIEEPVVGEPIGTPDAQDITPAEEGTISEEEIQEEEAPVPAGEADEATMEEAEVVEPAAAEPVTEQEESAEVLQAEIQEGQSEIQKAKDEDADLEARDQNAAKLEERVKKIKPEKVEHIWDRGSRIIERHEARRGKIDNEIHAEIAEDLNIVLNQAKDGVMLDDEGNGMPTRKQWDEAVYEGIENIEDFGDFSVGSVDLTNIGGGNLLLGHEGVNKVLAHIGVKILRKGVKENGGYIFRIGGDELAAAFPGKTTAESDAIMKGLQQEIDTFVKTAKFADADGVMHSIDNLAHPKKAGLPVPLGTMSYHALSYKDFMLTNPQFEKLSIPDRKSKFLSYIDRKQEHQAEERARAVVDNNPDFGYIYEYNENGELEFKKKEAKDANVKKEKIQDEGSPVKRVSGREGGESEVDTGYVEKGDADDTITAKRSGEEQGDGQQLADDWNVEDEAAGEEIVRKRPKKKISGPDIEGFYRSQAKFDEDARKADYAVMNAEWSTRIRERLLDYLGVHPNSNAWKSIMAQKGVSDELSEKVQIFTDKLNENKMPGEAWVAPDNLLEKYGKGEWHQDTVIQMIDDLAVSNKQKLRQMRLDAEAERNALKREKKRQSKMFEREAAEYEALTAPLEAGDDVKPEEMFSKKNKQSKAGVPATIPADKKVIKNAKKMLPSTYAKRVNIHIVDRSDQDINGQITGLGPDANGIVFYNDKNNSFEVLLSNELSGDSLMDTVYHEVVGHIGLSNVLRTDKRLLNKAYDLFLQDKEGRKLVVNNYGPHLITELENGGLRGGIDLMFSEWLAKKMADYHVDGKRDSLTQKVIRIIKSVLQKIFPSSISTTEDLMREISLRMPKASKKVYKGVDILNSVVDFEPLVKAYQEGTLINAEVTERNIRELQQLKDLGPDEIRDAVSGMSMETRLNPMVWKEMADKNPDFVRAAMRSFSTIPAKERTREDDEISMAIGIGVLDTGGDLRTFPGSRRIGLKIRTISQTAQAEKKAKATFDMIPADMQRSPEFWLTLQQRDSAAFESIANYAYETASDEVLDALDASFGEDVYETTLNDPEVRKQINSDSFKRWFGNSKVVDDNGDPLVVYHGTTHNFTEFGDGTHNVEGAVGAGHYFTTNPDDASENYAGEGPDLTARIEQRHDEIMGDEMDAYDIAQILGIDEADVEAKMDDGTITDDLAYEIAKKELKGTHEGAVMPAFVKIENPFNISTARETPVYIERDEEYYLDMAEEELDKADFEEDSDYQEALQEKADEMYYEDYDPKEEGPGVQLLDALESVLNWQEYTEVDVSETIGEFRMALTEGDIYDGETAWNWLKEKLAYEQDMETGKLNSGELARQIVEQAGYDGIEQDPKKSFPNMDNIEYGDRHFIAFNSNQIKSATGNDGSFNLDSPDIRRQAKPLSKAQEKTQKLMKAQRKVASLKKKLAGIEMNKKKLKQYMNDYVEGVQLEGNELTSQQKDKLRAYINGLDTKTERGLLGAKKNFAERVQKFIRDNDHKAAATRVEKVFKSIPKYMETRYQDQIDKSLADVDFKKLTEKKADRLREILKIAETNNLIPAELIAETERLGKRSLKGKDAEGEYEISTQELNSIADKIEQAIHQYKLKKKLYMDRRGREYAKIESQAIDNIKAASKTGRIGGFGAFAQDAQEEKLEEKTSRTGVRDTVTGTGAMTPEVLTEIVEGKDIDDDNAVIGQTIYGEMDAGLTDKLRYLHEVGDAFKKKFPLAVAKRISPIFHAGGTQKAASNMADDINLPSGIVIKMTPAQRLSVYMHSLNEHSRNAMMDYGVVFATRKLSEPLKLSEADVNHIAATVERDPDLKDMAMFIWDVLNNKNSKAIAETWKSMNGTEMLLVKNYFPLLREGFYKDFLFKGVEATKISDFNQFMGQYLESAGALKERKAGAQGAVVIEDAIQTFMRSSNLAASYSSFADRLRHGKQLVSDLERTMKMYGRGKEHLRLNNYLKDVEGSLQYQPDILESTAKNMFGNMTRAVLGLKPGVIARQVWSYPLIVTEIDAPHVIKGMSILPFSKKAREMEQYIKENSPQLRARFEGGSSNAELGDRQAAQVAAQQLGKKQDFWDWTTAGISSADKFTIIRVVNAAKSQIEAQQPKLKGEAKDKAIFKLAEKAIRRTQPMYSNVHRSEISRSKRLLTKATFAFTSATNQISNTLRRSFMRYGRTGDNEALAKALLAVLSGMAAMVGIDELVDKLYARDTDKVTRSFRGLKYGTSPVYGSGYVMAFAEMITRKMRKEGHKYRGVNNFYDNLIISTLRQIWEGGSAAAQALADKDIQAGDYKRVQWAAENMVDGVLKTFAGVSPKAMKQLVTLPGRHIKRSTRGEIYRIAEEAGYRPKGINKQLTRNGKKYRLKASYVNDVNKAMYRIANEIFEQKRSRFEMLDKEKKAKYIKSIYEKALARAKREARRGRTFREIIAFEKEK